jgi:iron complex outermembrane receptor protein
VTPTNPTGVCAPGTPQREVAPEIPTNYEIGAKKVMFDGRAIADINAFYIKMENYQGQVCVTNSSNLLTCTVTNFDGVISKGIEANLFGRIADNFTVNTGLIWNPAQFPKHDSNGGPFIGVDGTNISGKQLQLAPVWKFTFSGEYSHPVFSGLEGFVGGDAVYKSKIAYSASTDPLLSYPSNIVLGAHAGVRAEKGNWSASLFVRNLTNEHIPVLRQAGFPYGLNYGQFLSTGSFRVVGVSLDAEF